nr:MAG TPA: hypothetical protein [Caudoviricetes sp.]
MSFVQGVADALLGAAGFIARPGNNVAGIPVSVKESESHAFTSTPIDTAVENGAILTDHVVVNPVEVEVVFDMVNTRSLLSYFGTVSTAFDAFEYFESLLSNRELVTLITEHKVYANMLCIDFTPSHVAPFKGALKCTARFRQINFVTILSSGRQESQLGPGAKKTASQASQKGQQTAPDLNTTQLGKLGQRAGLGG